MSVLAIANRRFGHIWLHSTTPPSNIKVCRKLCPFHDRSVIFHVDPSSIALVPSFFFLPIYSSCHRCFRHSDLIISVVMYMYKWHVQVLIWRLRASDSAFPLEWSDRDSGPVSFFSFYLSHHHCFPLIRQILLDQYPRIVSVRSRCSVIYGFGSCSDRGGVMTGRSALGYHLYRFPPVSALVCFT